MNYNYYEAVKEDVKEYLKNDAPEFAPEDLLYSRSSMEGDLYDDLWAVDSITGNGSGSYTFNRYTAQEYVSSNLDLLREACQDFGVESSEIGEKFLDDEWEWMDVTIRCYVLASAISDALDEIEAELEEE